MLYLEMINLVGRYLFVNSNNQYSNFKLLCCQVALVALVALICDVHLCKAKLVRHNLEFDYDHLVHSISNVHVIQKSSFI